MDGRRGPIRSMSAPAIGLTRTMSAPWVVMMGLASDSETSRLDRIAGMIGPRMAPAITVNVAEAKMIHSVARLSEESVIQPYSRPIGKTALIHSSWIDSGSQNLSSGTFTSLWPADAIGRRTNGRVECSVLRRWT